MSAPPQFSIIIPVYNAARFLKPCLESVRTQTEASWECLCIDDGSSDDSARILDDYAREDGRFVVLHQANAGVSAARNRGLDLARGEWISFVDADDWVSPGYLSAFAAFPTKADITFTPPTFHWDDGVERTYDIPNATYAEGPAFGDFCYRMAFNETPRNLFGYTWNKFFRRTTIFAAGARFEEGLTASEDEVFTLAVCRAAHSAAMMHQSVYFYRLGSGGLTATGKGKELFGYYEAAAASDQRPGIVRLCRTRLFSELFWIAVAHPFSSTVGRLCDLCRKHDDHKGYHKLLSDLLIRLSRLPFPLGRLTLHAFFIVAWCRNYIRCRRSTGLWDRRFQQ